MCISPDNNYNSVHIDNNWFNIEFHQIELIVNNLVELLV